MTSLPVDATQLVMGLVHSCASLVNGDLQCMHHGYNRSCDIGKYGDRCHDDRFNVINRDGELGLPSTKPVAIGKWYTVPKFSALEPAVPNNMYGSPANLSGTNSSTGRLVVTWDSESYASSYVVRYREENEEAWTYLSSSRI